MSLPGKEPARSLRREPAEDRRTWRGGGGGLGRGGYLVKSVTSKLQIPRKLSTLALTVSAKPPETQHRRGSEGPLEEELLALAVRRWAEHLENCGPRPGRPHAGLRDGSAPRSHQTGENVSVLLKVRRQK